jgi:CRP-like cAMP-binding protein
MLDQSSVTQCALTTVRLLRSRANAWNRECRVLLEHPALDRMVHKLARRAPLDDADRKALGALSFRIKTFEPGSYIVREGMNANESALILEGFAFRHKLTQEGSRQIVSFHVAGDFVDLEGSLLKVADHNVQTLNRCQIAAIPVREIVSLIDGHPRIGRALWIDTLIDASIYREWVMNVGRRTGSARIAHLLCELAKRLELAGLGDEHGYALPMTQEQLADATGLTPVHVSRCLKALQEEGLISRNGRYVSIPDWERLRDASGFSELYLHLDQAA